MHNKSHFKGTFLFILDSHDINPIDLYGKSMYILDPLNKSFHMFRMHLFLIDKISCECWGKEKSLFFFNYFSDRSIV